MALEPDAVRALWPELAPLLTIDGSPWRFDELRHGRFFGVRTGPGWVEACYVADRHHVSINRHPTGSSHRRSTVPILDFTGPITDAVAALLTSPIEDAW